MNGATSTERAALAATARLLGRLLIRELDEATLAELRQPEVAAALAAAGITVPAGEASAVVDALAADYYQRFITPERRPPLIQSLWADGQYESETTAAVRAYAEQAGLAFERAIARGAPPDHLGAELTLWAEIAEPWPDGAARFVQDHLRWAVAPLRAQADEVVGDGSAFYGEVCAAAAELIEQL